MKETKEKQGLRLSEAFGYGLGAFPANLSLQYRNGYLLSFMTDIAHINAAIAGTIMTIMVIWDAINDAIVAVLADRTNSKMGRYRPWMLFGSILLAVTTTLAFTSPSENPTVSIIYFFIVLLVLCWTQTMFTVPWQALNSTMTTVPNDRNRLLVFRQLFGTFAGILVSVIVMPVVRSAGSEAAGWQRMAILVGAITILGGVLCSFLIRRKDQPEPNRKVEKFSWKTQGRIVFKNKPLLLCAGIYGALYLMMSVVQTINIYFLRIVFGSTKPISLVGIITLVFSLIVVPFMPKLIRKFDKVKLALAGFIIYMVQPLGILVLKGTFLSDGYAFSNTFLIILLVLITFGTFGNTLANISVIAFIMDITDYTELHFGQTQAGFVNSCVTLLKKLSGSIATLLIGFGLAAVNYVDYTHVTPAIKNMVTNLYIWPMLLFGAIGILLLILYPLKKQQVAEMREELNLIRGKNQETAEA